MAPVPRRRPGRLIPAGGLRGVPPPNLTWLLLLEGALRKIAPLKKHGACQTARVRGSVLRALWIQWEPQANKSIEGTGPRIGAVGTALNDEAQPAARGRFQASVPEGRHGPRERNLVGIGPRRLRAAVARSSRREERAPRQSASCRRPYFSMR